MNEILLLFRLSVVTSGYTTILLLSGGGEYWKQSLWSIRKVPVLRSALQPRPLPIKKLSLPSSTTFSVKRTSKKCFKFVACVYSEVVGWLNESWTSTEWRKVVAVNFKYRHAICVRLLKKQKKSYEKSQLVETGPLGRNCGHFIPWVRLGSAHCKLSVSNLCRLTTQKALPVTSMLLTLP